MKIAVFGAGGQVGSALARIAQRRRHIALKGFDRAAVDITDLHAVDAALRSASADAVINCAAYTAVDKAEAEPALASDINEAGARNVAKAAEAQGAALIHLSTDYVFDGTGRGAYLEDDAVAPIGAYGISKAKGEAAVREACRRALIVRTAWVYGLEGANFVKTMLRLGSERDELRVVEDQQGCPTFADDLAEGLLTIAEKSGSHAGIYHLAGTGRTTWFEFAEAIFAEAARHGRRTPRLVAIPTEDYPTPAKRPLNSVLDCTKTKRDFAVELPPWQDGLTRMLNALLKA